MSYGYILRKYKLPQPEESRFKALKQFRLLHEQGKTEQLVIDEFAVDDQPKTKGWWNGFKKQFFG